MQGSSLIPSFIYNKALICFHRKPVFGGNILRCKQLRQICGTINLMNPQSYKKITKLFSIPRRYAVYIYCNSVACSCNHFYNGNATVLCVGESSQILST